MISRARFVNNIRLQHQQQVAVRLFATEASVKPTAVTTTDFETEYASAIPFSKIPGPTIFSLIIDGLRAGGTDGGIDINALFKSVQKEYGELVVVPGIFGKPRMLFTFNPKHFQTIYHNEGPWPIRFGMEIVEHYRKEVRPDIFGKYQGLLNSNGKEWSDFRKTVNPIMIKPQAAKLYVSKIDEVAQNFVERIRHIRDPRTLQAPDNFEDDINRWSLETIGVIAMDTRFGLISDKSDERAAQFIGAVKDFFRLLGEMEMKPSLWRLVATKQYKAMIKTLDTLTKCSGEYIEQAKKATEASLTKDDREQSILEKLLKIDPAIANVMAMDMIFAGVDTTSSAFTGLLYMLAKNSEKQEILRKEIMTILPEPNSSFTAEKMTRLPYLRACLKEALRLYPIVNAHARITSQDLVLNGYQIPKGVHVLMVTTILQHDEKHYPQAREFIPERWLRDQEDKCPASAKQAHPFTYLPFGFGPRMCIGRRFAEMEMEILAAKILRNFRVKWEHPDLKFKTFTLNIPNGKLMFTFENL